MPPTNAPKTHARTSPSVACVLGSPSAMLVRNRLTPELTAPIVLPIAVLHQGPPEQTLAIPFPAKPPMGAETSAIAASPATLPQLTSVTAAWPTGSPALSRAWV